MNGVGTELASYTLPIRREDSPRLTTLGREAMIRPWDGAGEAVRLCSDVSVLTGGRGPPLDTYHRRSTQSKVSQA